MSGKKAKIKRKQQHEGQLEKSGPSFMSMANGIHGPYKDMAQMLTQETETLISHSGPLPHPETLKEYEKLIPQAAERLLALVEKEQENRHGIERQLTEAVIKDAEKSRQADKRGDFIAVYIYSTCMLAGGAILYFGYPVALAATLMGTPLIASLATFLLRRRQTKLPKNGQVKPR